MEPADLERYAELIIRSGLQVRPGDPVVAIHGEPAHAPLVGALAEAAYRAGVRLVDALYVDPEVRRARVRHAPVDSLEDDVPWGHARMRGLVRDAAGLIAIGGPSNPSAGADLDPDRSALTRDGFPGRERYLRAVAHADARFAVVAWPLPGWCARVYPELTPADATRRVEADLLSFVRLGPDDGAGTAAWDAHVATLVRRAAALTTAAFDEVILRGPGTDLRVGFPSGTTWVAADSTTRGGRRYSANLPTEEAFTSPHAARTEGTFACSRPLDHSGRVIEDLAGEFRGGRLVRLSARRESDRDFFARYLARHRDADRLGELALVDGGSRIGQTGRTYGITLFDENAASHIAFGAAFDSTRSDERRRAGGHGLNRSATHVDVMIGRPELEVSGRRGRTTIPIVADGAFQGAFA